MYDYPRPSSPSATYYAAPPSPVKRHHHSRRSHSPVPRIATLLPNHHGEYSPNSRAADISRLLDPSYSSQSSSSSASSSRAYVDHRGEFHDPDYRDFPTYPHQNASRIRSTTTAATRKQRRTSASSHTYDRRPLTQPSAWDRVVDSDDDDESESESQTHFSPFQSTDSRARRNHHYSYYFGEIIPMSSSPTSIQENALGLDTTSPFEEEDAFEEPRKLRRSSRRRSGESKRAAEERDEEEAQTKERDSESIIESGGSDVPSCTHSLQRQWQSLSLRFRFGVFHAKQRLRRSIKH
ncbi:hypothetical protein BXZ70DRAFT_1003819 [Cristinia sonorae]|uniref:Uncharacterized protein n=1 Tax=Cristinia sonorae TaxID=1940300 RepID=A0A8K0UYG5_9AGAR|nr:hypothetical protein BXZ70DRAFT_1003819 [Cristinia sonorae]